MLLSKYKQDARITQSVECCANNAVVLGSIPSASIFPTL